MYYQAALCAANNPDHAQGVLVPGGSGGTASIDITKISKGKFGAYPDEDSSFPESTAAKRATFTEIITLVGPTPIGMQMMQVPKNMKAFLTLNGFPEIVIPEAESYDKQMFEIEQLLKTSPIPPDPQMQDQAMVDHAAAAEVASVWRAGCGDSAPTHAAAGIDRAGERMGLPSVGSGGLPGLAELSGLPQAAGAGQSGWGPERSPALESACAGTGSADAAPDARPTARRSRSRISRYARRRDKTARIESAAAVNPSPRFSGNGNDVVWRKPHARRCSDGRSGRSAARNIDRS
jgi:hypothetical protein